MSARTIGSTLASSTTRQPSSSATWADLNAGSATTQIVPTGWARLRLNPWIVTPRTSQSPSAAGMRTSKGELRSAVGVPGTSPDPQQLGAPRQVEREGLARDPVGHRGGQQARLVTSVARGRGSLRWRDARDRHLSSLPRHAEGRQSRRRARAAPPCRPGRRRVVRARQGPRTVYPRVLRHGADRRDGPVGPLGVRLLNSSSP